MKLRKQYHNELVDLKGNIRGFCRVRPVIKEDGHGQNSETFVSVDKESDKISTIDRQGRIQSFQMDKVFGEDSSQRMVFEEMKSLVTSCIDGYNVCIFAYGQTCSGKTHTMELFKVGQQNRVTAATNMNEHSLRSHALLSITVIGQNITTGAKTTGKLNLVDLAGSDRVSLVEGPRLLEAQAIIKSLSSLGDVINALGSKQSHILYRNSKLTYLLQDSLGRDSKTLMIIQIVPVRKNEEETICSLNFAQRVKNIELGTATRRLENGNGAETKLCSPARAYLTPRQLVKPSYLFARTPTGSPIRRNTPSKPKKKRLLK